MLLSDLLICDTVTRITEGHEPEDFAIKPMTTNVRSGSSSSVSSSSSSDSTSSSSDQSVEIGPDASPVRTKILGTIEEAIDRLHRLSVAIRKSSITSRNSKAATFVERDEEGNDLSVEFEKYAAQKIKFTFKEINEQLCERLAGAIALRRRRFQYRKSHQKKLEYSVYRPAPVSTVVPQKQISLLATATENKSLQATTISRPSIQQSATTASAFDHEKLSYPAAPASRASTARSASMIVQNYSLDFPKPPFIAPHSKEFKCPYCYMILPVTEASDTRWK